MVKGLRICEQTSSIVDAKQAELPYHLQVRAVLGRHNLPKQNKS